MHFRLALRQDMPDVQREGPPHIAADQMQPVALQRVALAAHQRDRPLGDGMEQGLDPRSNDGSRMRAW